MIRRSLTLLFLLFAIAAAGLYAFQQPPAIIILPATPSTVYVNTTTTVVITAQVTDARVITTGVNLIQVDRGTGAQTVVGTLASKGNGIFNIAIEQGGNVSKLLSYQVSAAFAGILKRSVSDIITVLVAPVGTIIPSDPGPAGAVTLAGIDTDRDGVRDDVQRLIASFGLPSSTLSILNQDAVVIQLLILGASSPDTPLSLISRDIVITRCLRTLLGDNYTNITNGVRAAMLNTNARLVAYFTTENQAGAWTSDGLPDGTAACQSLP